MQIGMTLQFAQKAYCVLQAMKYRTCGLTILSDRSIQKLCMEFAIERPVAIEQNIFSAFVTP